MSVGRIVIAFITKVDCGEGEWIHSHLYDLIFIFLNLWKGTFFERIKAGKDANFRPFFILYYVNHSAGKRDRDLTPSPYARWPEGPRALLSERSEL